MKKNNIQDIARAAGVSVTTVSRILNHKPYVKDDIKEKVLAIAEQLNYQPKTIARRDIVVIAIEGWEQGPLGMHENILVSNLVRLLNCHQMQIEIIPLSMLPERPEITVRLIIGMAYRPEACAKLAAIRQIPVLMINNIIPEAHHVCTNHRGGIEKAIDYLWAHGHRRIGLFRKTEGVWGEDERLTGYRQALARHGAQYDETLVKVMKGQSVYEALAKIILARPTALIACGENSLLPVNYALKILNRNVPEDISIIAFEDPAVSPFLLPHPTCLDQDLEEVSRKAAETAIRLLAQPELPLQHIMLEQRLIERESVRHISN